MPPLSNTPLPRYNVPIAAVEPESIESRANILVRAGNEPLAAEFIAKKAHEQQVLRDLGLKQEIEVRTRSLTGTVAETKLAGTGTDIPPSDPPKDVLVPVATPVFADLTVEGLRAHAVAHGLEYDRSHRSKADLAAAISAAHAAKYPAI